MDRISLHVSTMKALFIHNIILATICSYANISTAADKECLEEQKLIMQKLQFEPWACKHMLLLCMTREVRQKIPHHFVSFTGFSGKQ